MVENQTWLKRAFRERPIHGWLWTLLAVVGPLPLLFHGPFLERVILPFLTALGVG